jgi:hypothetical protein
MDPPFVLTKEEYESLADTSQLLGIVTAHFEKPPREQQFLGVAEVAEMLGVPKSNVSQRKVALPDPIARTSSGPIWLRREVVPAARRLRERRQRRTA